MGLFSAQCKGCGHSLLSPPATNERNRWMSEVVAIGPNNGIHTGTYDGYGRIDGWDPMETGRGDLEENSLYHQACWEIAGKPTTYQGESDYASDQGWFFEDHEHDCADPRTTHGYVPRPEDCVKMCDTCGMAPAVWGELCESCENDAEREEDDDDDDD